MAVTALDPKTALIVIDLQKGVVSLGGGRQSMQDVVQRVCALTAAFRRQGLPVVLVNVAGRAPGRCHDRLPCGCSPLERHARLPQDRRDRHDARDHGLSE